MGVGGGGGGVEPWPSMVEANIKGGLVIRGC